MIKLTIGKIFLENIKEMELITNDGTSVEVPKTYELLEDLQEIKKLFLTNKIRKDLIAEVEEAIKALECYDIEQVMFIL